MMTSQNTIDPEALPGDVVWFQPTWGVWGATYWGYALSSRMFYTIPADSHVIETDILAFSTPDYMNSNPDYNRCPCPAWIKERLSQRCYVIIEKLPLPAEGR